VRLLAEILFGLVGSHQAIRFRTLHKNGGQASRNDINSEFGMTNLIDSIIFHNITHTITGRANFIQLSLYGYE
jgi:hypothetical protein